MIMDMVKQEMDAAIKHLDHAFQKLEQVELLRLWFKMLVGILRSNVANQSKL